MYDGMYHIIKMNKLIITAVMLAAIASMIYGTAAIAGVRADINTRSAFIQTDKNVQLKVIGVPGPQGEKGDTGGKGADGAPGQNGKDGKDGTTLDNETLANVNALSANFATFQQILQAYQNGSLNGKDGVDGTNGKDGTNGTVTFICFDANNHTMVCPFTEIPNGNTTGPIVCEPPQVLNTTSNTCETPIIPPVTCEPPAVLNSTTNQCETPIVIPPVDNNTGNNTGGNDTNGNNTNGNGTILTGYDIPTGLAKILGL